MPLLSHDLQMFQGNAEEVLLHPYCAHEVMLCAMANKYRSGSVVEDDGNWS